MKHASLCTGIGACELAAKWLGWENVFSCEIDDFCNRVLKYYYPTAEHYRDIYETDFNKWKHKIDVLSAGFPCQPFSNAGNNRGAEDDRYIWPEVLRAIREVKPSWFVGENVTGIVGMVFPGEEIRMENTNDLFEESYIQVEEHQRFILHQICNDIESIGYSVQPVIIPACAVGAPHRRDRVWIIANSNSDGFELENGFERSKEFENSPLFKSLYSGQSWKKFPTQSLICGGNDGLPDRLSGITIPKWIDASTKAYGNSMLPQLVSVIFGYIEEVEKMVRNQKK